MSCSILLEESFWWKAWQPVRSVMQEKKWHVYPQVWPHWVIFPSSVWLFTLSEFPVILTCIILTQTEATATCDSLMISGLNICWDSVICSVVYWWKVKAYERPYQCSSYSTGYCRLYPLWLLRTGQIPAVTVQFVSRQFPRLLFEETALYTA